MKNVYKVLALMTVVLCLVFGNSKGAFATAGHQVTVTLTSSGSPTVIVNVASGYSIVAGQSVSSFPWTYTFTTTLNQQPLNFTATSASFLTDGGQTFTGTVTVDGNTIYSATNTTVGTFYMVQ